MQNEPRKRLETLFHASRDRKPGPEREAYLDGACGDDAVLRERVEALLSAHDEATGFLEGPVVGEPQEGPGTSIGPYKLLQEIGEGGMGIVYMAEQERPVRRKVALKVIKLGMDTKQVIARFEAERQALAMMDHAHIARVLDAGATETGRPYFVMELVRGVPINEYCDTHKLSTERRLGLFVDVCRAVQHAHQKGIIHRDLKPTNVLVTSHDGTPIPKIIDFGVAKATNQSLTERTLFTEFHQIIGTPEYMSPEQAEMSGLDVDTRSDIYALGVLLYQLLTGTTPVDPTELRTAAFEEMTRMIREDEAPAPSTRISKLGVEGERIAKHRNTDVLSLSRHFRGDLDWIVMKALEKDRTRRYDTAAAFAEDVVRHLEDRPVEAGPPGAMYRLRKFTHRNRRAVTAALVLVAALGLGFAGTTAGFLRARAEADRSGRISASLQDVLAMSDPTRSADGSDVQDVLATVRDVFGEDHATYAAVLGTLAMQVHDAGDFEAAVNLGRQSLTVWKKVYGDKHPNTGIALARLGSYLRAKGDDAQAEEALRAALAILDGAHEASGLTGHGARLELADLLGNRGDYQEADELLVDALESLRASPTPPRFKILETLEKRVAMQLNQGSPNISATLREVYDEAHAFYPDDSPIVAMASLGYGKSLFQEGEREAAEPYLREAVRRFRAWPTSPGVYFVVAADSLFQVIRGREDRASMEEADELLRELIAIARSFWGADELATNLKYYASRMYDRGRHVDALEAMLDAHGVLVEAGRSLKERENLRDNLTALAFQVAVEPGQEALIYERAREAAERALEEEPGHPVMSVVLGVVLVRQGEYDLAAEMLDVEPRSLSSMESGLARRVAPADHAFRALAHARLGDVDFARSELRELRAALAGASDRAELVRLSSEVEDLIASTPAPNGDG